MKKLKSGYAGCLVVMIALMGTVAGGVAASVVTHTEYTTEWEYLTEVTSLFDGETEIPTFTTYSPSYNWTGWSVSDYDGGTYTGGYPSVDEDSPYSAIECGIGEAYYTDDDSYVYIYVAKGSAVSFVAGTVDYDEDGNATDGDSWEATSVSDLYVGLSVVSEDEATSEYPAGSVVGTLTTTGVYYIYVTDGDSEYVISLYVVTAVTTETAGISFSSQSSINSYPIVVSQNSEEVDVDVTTVESSIEFDHSSWWIYDQYVYGISVNPGTAGAGLTVKDMESICFLPEVVTVADIISAYSDAFSKYSTIRLSTTGDTDGIVIARGWNGSESTSDWIRSEYKTSGLALIQYCLDWYTDGENTVGYIDINLSTYTVTAYTASGEYLWMTDADGVWVAWGGTTDTSGDSLVGVPTTVSRTVFGSDSSAVGYWSADTTYMVVSEGISIDAAAGTFVTWANGQRNGSASILFYVDDSAYSYNRVIVPLYDLNGLAVSTSVQYALEVTVSAVDGVTYVSIAYGIWDGTDFTAVSGMTAARSLGTWSVFVLTLDTANGSYTVSPVTSFTSFTDYEVADASFTLDLSVSGCTFTRMLWEGTGSSMRFGIVSTDVWLNTYDTVLQDAVLDIMEYFPDIETIRLNIYSFALYGDSITINGQTFEVDGSTISIVTSEGTSTETLANMYVSFTGGYTYLTFVNSGITYNLGVTVSTEIIMNGTWYFTAAAWSGTVVETEVSEWDPTGFAFSWVECAAVMCGLLVVAAAVVWRVNKGMSWVDGAIIAGAVAVAWVLTGLSLF